MRKRRLTLSEIEELARITAFQTLIKKLKSEKDSLLAAKIIVENTSSANQSSDPSSQLADFLRG